MGGKRLRADLIPRYGPYSGVTCPSSIRTVILVHSWAQEYKITRRAIPWRQGTVLVQGVPPGLFNTIDDLATTFFHPYPFYSSPTTFYLLLQTFPVSQNFLHAINLVREFLCTHTLFDDPLLTQSRLNRFKRVYMP